MLCNEHMSKVLFAEAGIPVPQGEVVTPATRDGFTPSFPLPWFCKAQVLTGGRGKAGGILRVTDAADLGPTLDKLFAMDIKGHAVPLVRVEPATDIAREFYLSMAVARNRESLALTVSSAGGMEVEAQKEHIYIQDISLRGGMAPHQLKAAFFHLGLDSELEKPAFAGFHALITALYKAVTDYGLLLAEINPLVLTAQGKWIALDGKVEIDDNVRDIRADLERFYTPEHATREENEARGAGLSYVPLDGWVGITVNGAGLAMATMDLLNFAGLSAANFMDLGGAADKERMAKALELLFGDDRVKAIFLNLFGGIVSCRKVAEALAGALDGQSPPKPIVARMAGFESEAGREILAGLGQPDIHIATAMPEALEALAKIKPADAPGDKYERPDEPEPNRIEVVAESASISATDQPDPMAALRPLGLGTGARILVQGITGKTAQLHTGLMQGYGANIVAGVTPFKEGQEILGVPVYNSVRRALAKHDIDASIIFVPPAFAADAILEAAANDIPVCVCITEGIPQHEMLKVKEVLRTSFMKLVGPNTPGVIVPGETKIGIMPGDVYQPGPVAVFSRSGTLTYEACYRLSQAGMGQSLCVGMGGDPFVGMGFIDLFEAIRHDPATKAVMVLGEIGGSAEERLAAWVRETAFPKPVLAFIAGRTAPAGKRLGHAGAILEEGGGGIEDKLSAMRDAGFALCPDLESIPGRMQALLGRS